jgi:hypothetical protein
MANTHTTTASMTVKIVSQRQGQPAGKLADAELLFGDGSLAGLKLIGFAIWERRSESPLRVENSSSRSPTTKSCHSSDSRLVNSQIASRGGPVVFFTSAPAGSGGRPPSR